jgi:acyl carrier protein
VNKVAVYEKLREVIASEFKIDTASISLEMRLHDDLQLDSLDMVDLILHLSDYIGEKVNPSLFKDACTVQDLVDSVCSLWGSAKETLNFMGGKLPVDRFLTA